MTYCTYITVHQPTGMYYIGKTSIDRITGSACYKGGGVKLRKAFKLYPRHLWDTGILWEFDSSDEALSDEGGIVNQECLNDPLCLNLWFGGGARSWPEGWKPKTWLRGRAPKEPKPSTVRYPRNGKKSGWTVSPETKLKMSLAKLGKKHSEEHIQNAVESKRQKRAEKGVN